MPKTRRYCPTCQIKEWPPEIVFFILLLLLKLAPYHVLNLDARSKSMVSSNTAVTVVMAEAEAKEASGQYLRMTEPIPSF